MGRREELRDEIVALLREAGFRDPEQQNRPTSEDAQIDNLDEPFRAYLQQNFGVSRLADLDETDAPRATLYLVRLARMQAGADEIDESIDRGNRQ